MSVSLKTMKLLQDAGVTGEPLRAIIASIIADFGETPHVSLTAAPRMSRRRRGQYGCGPLSEATRQEVFARDGFICQYCGEDNPALMTVDHIIARSRGGTNEVSNLKTACSACNQDKADLSIEEWEKKKALACAPIPERKAYTLRDLRRPRLAHDAATVREAERLRKAAAISHARGIDRRIVEGAQRALAAAGIA